MNRHTSNPFLSNWDDEAETIVNNNNTTLNNKSPFDLDDDDVVVQDGGGGGALFDSTTSATNTPNTSSTRRSSSGQAGDSFGANMTNRPGLYRRNMSSFEAASLVEQQQQQAMQENGTAASNSARDDIIAKMTAEFQSAIQTNDKQFSENMENLNQFDPFETIVDDDVSIPSPNPSTTNQQATNNSSSSAAVQNTQNFNKLTNVPDATNNTDEGRPDSIDLNNNNNNNNGKSTNERLEEQNKRYAHDSIDDDDDELVSTPVRNIKSSPPPPPSEHAESRLQQQQVDNKNSIEPNTLEDSSTTNADHLHRPTDANQDSRATDTSNNNNNTDSMAKATMFASLLASAEAGGGAASSTTNINDALSPLENGSLDGGGTTTAHDGDISESPSSHINALEPATHVIKGSPNSVCGDGGVDRPVSFFDPFETVIDKDALTSLINDNQQQQEHEENEDAAATNSSVRRSDDALCSDDEKLVEDSKTHDEDALPPQTSDNNNNSYDTYDANTATSRPSGRATINVNSGFVAPQVTPAKRPATSTSKQSSRRPQKVAQKVDADADSSDSSEEDDRIQIVIRARDTSELESNNSKPAAIVPLLPPPPSKNSIRQARERGQVEDIPSPIMSYKTRTAEGGRRKQRAGSASSSSSSSSPVRENEQHDDAAKAKSKRSEIDTGSLDETNNNNGADADDDADDNSDADDGQFVIPMRHSDGEDDDYGKPETPLYDDDTSYVLEDFPPKYEGAGWEMMLRYPPKKKLTSNRFWKKIFVKLAQVPLAPESSSSSGRTSRQQQQQQQTSETAAASEPSTCMALQVFDKPTDKKPIQEIPIQATYTVSEISSQLFDQFGKIFTIKLQYIFYKERVGVRQGQLARFIHTGHIGSSTTSGGHGVDPLSYGAIKRMGAPIEHSPQISQIIKLGCTSYEDMKQFKECLEDCLFKMPIHRDRALSTYKTEEVQMAVRDETYIELNQIGTITKQLARVRLFFLSFLNGTPIVEVGINDIHRQGREIVGRMDILPVVTEEWIRLEAWELHSTVDQEQFESPDSRIVKLTPPDATFFELLRFRVRPPRNRELPLQISANMTVTRTKVSIDCDVMVPGCVSRKHGQIPCENISIKIHMPECWIYFFREEKHFRMGSKKSVNRRPGKVKGIERFLGGGGLQDFNDESSLIEVTSGQAKYEHHHHAIVWRAARWPKESQSAYVQNTMKIRLPLTAYDKMPENFQEFVHVEYSMPATTVSHTTLRSISVNPYEDEPPEKYVKYSAKYEYKVRMRLSVNLGTRGAGASETVAESSPIVIMKQPDLQDDLQREEDSDDDDDDDQSNEENIGTSN